MTTEEKTMKSERIYDGKIINLRVDTVELPGQKYFKREIVEHPGAVAVVPILPDGRVVLIKQYRKALERVLFEIPAGKIERNEEPALTAIRELKEETGYSSDKVQYLTEIYTSPGFCDEKISIFLAQNLIPGDTEFDLGEDIETVICDVDECIRKIDHGEIIDAKTIVGILWIKQFIK